MLDAAYRGVVTFINDQYETERMHLFTCERWSGEMTDCDEGELVWLPKTEMNSLPMWEGDRIFHRLLDEGVPFFELELVYSGEKLLSASLDGRQLEI